MSLVNPSTLAALFNHVEIGKEYHRDGQAYTAASKTIYSGTFEGETEYWIEIELVGPDARYFVQFDYGQWSLSRPLTEYSPSQVGLLTPLNRLTEGSIFRLGDQRFSVYETAEATVVDVTGLPADSTSPGETLRYADLAVVGTSIVARSIEWDPSDPESAVVFDVQTLSTEKTMRWLGFAAHPDKRKAIRDILEDESEGEHGTGPGLGTTLVAFLLAGAATFFEECEFRPDCHSQVQSELQAQGIPAGESIRQADIQCSSSSYRRNRSFGK